MSDRSRRRRHRPHRSPHRPRWARLVLLGAGVLVLGVLVLVGWRAYQVERELAAARDAAQQLRAALRTQDIDAAREAAATMQEKSTAADAHTHGGSWRLLSSLPFAGDDARAVRTMSDVSARISATVVPSVVDAADLVFSGQFTPRGGRIPLQPITDLQRPLAASAEVVSTSKDDLSTLDGSYIGPVSHARDELLDSLTDASGALTPVVRAAELLPDMLGQDGARSYLLVLQNNAEIRSTGGFPGSTFLLTADDGAIGLTDPVSGAAIVRDDRQELEVTPAERQLFGQTVATSFTAAARIPDFPRAAQLMAERYEQRSGVQVDGVIATDPVLLSYLLRATGPVQVGDVSLRSQNVVKILLSDTYATYSDSAEQDAFFRDAGGAVFDALTTSGDPRKLISAVRRGAAEGRLLVLSEDRDEQRVLGAAHLTGELDEASTSRELGVFVNDETPPFGSKLSYYLDYDVSVTAGACAGGRAGLEGRLALRSSAPRDASELPDYVLGGSRDGVPGTEGLTIYLVGVPGGSIGQVAVDGTSVDTTTVDYLGRPVTRVEVDLAAGGRAAVTWQTTVAVGAGSGAEVDVRVTPGIAPQDFSIGPTRACQ